MIDIGGNADSCTRYCRMPPRILFSCKPFSHENRRRNR
jgi:hypothetical protein